MTNATLAAGLLLFCAFALLVAARVAEAVGSDAVARGLNGASMVATLTSIALMLMEAM